MQKNASYSENDVRFRLSCVTPPPPGGGVRLPLEAVPDEREEKPVKRVSKSGVGAERADREKGVKIARMREKGIQIAMIRVLAMRSYVERVDKLRQRVH